VAYNGPVMGFVGSNIELCGSVVTNSGCGWLSERIVWSLLKC
jgi:hypothetical protein